MKSRSEWKISYFGVVRKEYYDPHRVRKGKQGAYRMHRLI